MYLRIVSAEGVLYQGDVTKVIVPTNGGEYAFLPDHEALVTPLIAGKIGFSPVHVVESSLDGFRDHDRSLDIQGGLCTVDDNMITIVLQ